MNIQLKEANENSNCSKEIIRWYDNPDFGQDYSKNEVMNGMVKVTDGYRKSESFYHEKRLCLVIAFVELDGTVSMVGDRYSDLDEEDKQEFDKIRRELSKDN